MKENRKVMDQVLETNPQHEKECLMMGPVEWHHNYIIFQTF